MAFTTTLLIGFVAYIAFMFAVIYFCIIADPETSPMALYVTETLPQQMQRSLRRVLGKRMMSAVEFFADRLMLLMYCVVVFGSWSIIFVYVYPWVDRQSYVSYFHKVVGYAIFAACVISWRYASTASPGIITSKTVQRYDHFPYDDLLFVANRKCPTTGVPRLARSKFDRYKYHHNVPRFDHFCGWVYNTIGEENYRFFLLFLLVHVFMCVYGAYIVGQLFHGEILDKKLFDVVFFNRFTGEEIKPDTYIVAQYLFNAHLYEAGVFILMAVMSIALALFLGYHVYLTSRGMTTNESYKWSEVRKWYKTELKQYQQAVKNGQVVEDENPKKGQPVVSDGDVTSTSASSGSATDASTDADDAIQHPGPEPKNLYDRGFVENWKEVIFPMSLRKTGAPESKGSTVDKPKAM